MLAQSNHILFFSPFL